MRFSDRRYDPILRVTVESEGRLTMRERVKIRCGHEFITVTPARIRPLLVGANSQDVRFHFDCGLLSRRLKSPLMSWPMTYRHGTRTRVSGVAKNRPQASASAMGAMNGSVPPRP